MSTDTSVVGICSSSTTFKAAIVKAKDLTQNILHEPLEATPERHINDWTISDPTRWLVQEVPTSVPVGSRHELVWKKDEVKDEVKDEEVKDEEVKEESRSSSDSNSNSSPSSNGLVANASTDEAPSSEPSLLDKLDCGDRVAVMVQGMVRASNSFNASVPKTYSFL